METFSKDAKLAKQQDAMRQIQDEQRQGIQKKIKGNIDSNYEFPETEKDYYHLAVMTKNLDGTKKSFKEIKSVIKIHKGEFVRREKAGAFKTYDEVKILHNPNKKEDAAAKAAEEEQKAAEAKAKEAEDKAKADAEKAKANETKSPDAKK